MVQLSNNNKRRFVSMNNKRKRSNIRIETIIVLIIATCMIFLMNFMQEKLSDFAQLEQETLLINHDPNNPIHAELAKKIIQYRPGPYKMIEIYTSDLEIMMTLQFDQTVKYDTDIKKYPELIDLFQKNLEGHTQLIFGEKEEDIYFKWTEGENGNKYLIVVYASRHPVKNLWTFNFICYIVLILVFFLLIRLHMGSFNEKINQYKKMSDDVHSRVRR